MAAWIRQDELRRHQARPMICTSRLFREEGITYGTPTWTGRSSLWTVGFTFALTTARTLFVPGSDYGGKARGSLPPA